MDNSLKSDAVKSTRKTSTGADESQPESSEGNNVTQVDAIHHRFINCQKSTSNPRTCLHSYQCCEKGCNYRNPEFIELLAHLVSQSHGGVGICKKCEKPRLAYISSKQELVEYHDCYLGTLMHIIDKSQVCADMTKKLGRMHPGFLMFCADCHKEFKNDTFSLVQHCFNSRHGFLHFCQECKYPVFHFGIILESNKLYLSFHFCMNERRPFIKDISLNKYDKVDTEKHEKGSPLVTLKTSLYGKIQDTPGN